MNPYKIALVSDWFLPRTGGIERHIVELARELTGRGCSVEIITATRGAAVADGLPGVPIIRLDCPLLPRYGTIFRPRELAKLTELFSARGYDLVHGHSLYSPLAMAAMHAGRALRIPTVLTAHSLVRYAAMAVFRALDYRLMWSSWPSVITAVSEAVAADLRRASFNSEVHVVPNGLQLAAPVERGAGDGLLRIVSVTRLVSRKRPMTLMRAFAKLDQHVRGDRVARCRLVFVGDGPLRGALEREARRLHVGDRVEFRGWCSAEEVSAELRRANIFALATKKEAFGIAALEAAAAGTPVVVMGGSGAAELFTPGVDGLVADSDDALTTCLATLVEDRALRERLGDRARSLAERFAWSSVIDRTLGLYRLAVRRMGDRSGAALDSTVERLPVMRMARGAR